MTAMRKLLIALLATLALEAQEAVGVARLVHSTTLDPARLATALQSQDALVRATAARVILVRDVTALVPALRTALESERDAEAAREVVRALALLGSDDDVAFAVAQSARFPPFVDDALVDGIARSGVPRALDLYFRHRAKLRNVTLPGALPHWRNEGHVTATAARLLGARDLGSLRALVTAIEESGRTLDPGIASVIRASEDEKVRALLEPRPASTPRRHGISTPIPPPAFRLPFALPRGLGAEVLKSARCETGWLGAAIVTADYAGRVQEVDVGQVRALGRCNEALQTIARLSLAHPTRLGMGNAAPLLVARDARTPPCFDQSSSVLSVPGGDVKAPVVKTRAEPVFPPSALRRAAKTLEVEAEATITADGCVRDVRLLRQSPVAEINGSVVLALSKWTFTPGTLNGVPVDVLFTLTTSFRSP